MIRPRLPNLRTLPEAHHECGIGSRIEKVLDICARDALVRLMVLLHRGAGVEHDPSPDRQIVKQFEEHDAPGRAFVIEQTDFVLAQIADGEAVNIAGMKGDLNFIDRYLEVVCPRIL